MTENNDTQLEMDIKTTLMQAKATQNERTKGIYGSLVHQIQESLVIPYAPDIKGLKIILSDVNGLLSDDLKDSLTSPMVDLYQLTKETKDDTWSLQYGDKLILEARLRLLPNSKLPEIKVIVRLHEITYEITGTTNVTKGDNDIVTVTKVAISYDKVTPYETKED